MRHCLEKRPEDRFQSAKDVAFDLESASAPSDRRGIAEGAAAPRGGWAWLRVAGVAAALAAVAASGFWAGRRGGAARAAGDEPSFQRLTFGQGTIWSARFTPDGKSIVYSAAWDGEPIRLFLTRTDDPTSAPLNLPDANLLSVSSTGELAVSLGHRYEGWMGPAPWRGARCWGAVPDRSSLTCARPTGRRRLGPRHRAPGGDRERLEFPVGKMLYETDGFITNIRFSPNGDRIAFADHPLFADDAGWVAMVDLADARRRSRRRR